MSYPGFPLIPPFAVTAAYQDRQFGSGNLYTPGVPSVFESLVTPPTSGTDAETAADTHAEAVGFSAYSAANSVQVITVNGAPTGGTFTLTWGDDTTDPIAYNASAATVQAALDALQSTPAATGGVNDQQTVTITGAPTGGTFTLTYSGQTTAAIAYNANAAAVQSALEGLSNINPGDVSVTGSGPYVVTFTGALGNGAQSVMTASGASLTGGTSPSVGVTHTTTGVAPTQNIVVTGSAGGPYTATFQNVLSDIDVAEIVADGDALTGGTDPSVTVAVTTWGTAAFVNEALQDAHRHRDPMYDFYDQASGMHF